MYASASFTFFMWAGDFRRALDLAMSQILFRIVAVLAVCQHDVADADPEHVADALAVSFDLLNDVAAALEKLYREINPPRN